MGTVLIKTTNKKLYSKRFKLYLRVIELTKEYPQIPWSEIAKMRDILTHHYFGVDNKILWDTLGEDFDEFENVINNMLSKFDNKS